MAPSGIRWKFPISSVPGYARQAHTFGFFWPRGIGLTLNGFSWMYASPKKAIVERRYILFNHHFWYLGTASTPPKTNMEPENGGLEDEFPFQTGDFQVPCSFSGVYIIFRWVYGSAGKKHRFFSSGNRDGFFSVPSQKRFLILRMFGMVPFLVGCIYC